MKLQGALVYSEGRGGVGGAGSIQLPPLLPGPHGGRQLGVCIPLSTDNSVVVPMAGLYGQTRTHSSTDPAVPRADRGQACLVHWLHTVDRLHGGQLLPGEPPGHLVPHPVCKFRRGAGQPGRRAGVPLQEGWHSCYDR